MRAQLAFYKGPPQDDWVHTLSHYSIRVWTWSKWSHAELVLNGVCWSASGRDHGVRRKTINLESGRWDVVDITITDVQAIKALAWFTMHEGDGYDYRNIARFLFTPIGQDRDRWVCFEAIAAALGLAAAHKITANDLWEWAMLHKTNTEPALQLAD